MLKTRAPDVERRRFLTDIAALGIAAGASTVVALAQETTQPRSSGVGQVSIAETHARYATGLKYEELPADVIVLAKRAILDTFGCAFGGYDAGPTKIALQHA